MSISGTQRDQQRTKFKTFPIKVSAWNSSVVFSSSQCIFWRSSLRLCDTIRSVAAAAAARHATSVVKHGEFHANVSTITYGRQISVLN
jgi:hypothetical protein